MHARSVSLIESVGIVSDFSVGATGAAETVLVSVPGVGVGIDTGLVQEIVESVNNSVTTISFIFLLRVKWLQCIF